MSEQQVLRDRLRAHLALVRTAAEDNEFLDLPEAERLHGLLTEALPGWEQLNDAQRRTLADAVAYLVRTDDEENDLRSPIGFDDDAEVVEAALATLTRR